MPPSQTEATRLTKQQLAAEVLVRHGECSLQVLGASMMPTLWPHDMVRIVKRPFEELGVGNIVLYERNNRFYLHRLRKIIPEGSSYVLIARGDALPHNDPPLPASHVLGVLAGVRRGDQMLTLPGNPSLPLRAVARLLGWSGLLARLLIRFHTWNSHFGSGSTAESPAA